jgi:hypothetical protein
MSPRQDRRRRAIALSVLPILALVAASGQPAAASDQPTSAAAAAREARVARQLATSPDAVPSLADWSAGLPSFDARYTTEGFPIPAAAKALDAFKATPAWAARQAEARKLIDSLPELRIDDHAVFGTPEFVRSTAAFLTGANPGLAPADVVARYVHDHAALFEVNALEIPTARVERDFRTDHNGVTHLTLQQQLRGLDLFGSQVRANVMPDGRLINIASTMLPRPEGDFIAPAHVISAADAVIAAARAAGIDLAATPNPAGAPAGLSQRTTFAPLAQLRADEPVVTEMLYFPVARNDIRAAYSVVIPVPGAGHTYDIIVDAADGSLLSRQNRLLWDSTQPVTLRVYPSDGVAPMSPALATPGSTQAPLATRQLITVNPADVIPFSPNGWINDNDMETLGNNVDAHLDLNTDNVADVPRPNGGASRIFDFPMDPSMAPSTFQAAAVTQLFYLGNRFHDRLFALGFNEAAGNFQSVNFSGVGVANDRVQADAQDGNGVGANSNNANFATTGSDGSAARVQMYIFTGPTPDRDGDFDGDIVYHEYAHGLSIRLHGSGGLANLQSRGMGEGWSDFFGISLLAESTDNPDANFATGGYTTYQLATTTYTSNYYFGIRRFPYSTSLSINPLTLADIDPAQYSNPPTVPISPLVGVALSASANEVHNMGEVWCNTLLECRAQLWNRDGFSGNQLMMQLVVDGMKLSPANPNFLQARDAILQADLVNNASANRVPLWTGFAKRGFGIAATSPASTLVTVVESFQTPFSADFTFPDGLPTQLAPGVATSFRVRIAPVGLSLTSGTAAMSYSINGAPATTVPLTPTATPDEYTANIPPLTCFDRANYSFRTGTSLGNFSNPITGTYGSLVFTGRSFVANDSFEADTGWTVGPNTATAGLWVRADPVGTSAQPEDDHTAAGSFCWFTGQGAVGGAIGAADVDGGYTTLTSPVYDLTAAHDAIISYWRWYSNGAGGSPYADTFRVDVSIDNGSTWTNAETVGPGSASDPDVSPLWRFHTLALSSLGLSPTAQVKVRFVADDAGSGSVVEAAIDDFTIETVDCVAPPTCPADFNDSGDVSVQDIFDFLSAYFSNAPNADFNNSGGITVQDIFDFLSAYFTGCP